MPQALWNDIGPAAVYFGTAGVEAHIGDTFGGARWKLEVQTAMAYKDKTGDEPTDEIITGMPFTVETNLTNLTLEQLAAVIPGAVLSAGPTKKSMRLTSMTGRSLKANAKSLILKPIVDGEPTTDESLWVKVGKAYPKPNIECVYDAKTQKVYSVVWACFRDANDDMATFAVNET